MKIVLPVVLPLKASNANVTASQEGNACCAPAHKVVFAIMITAAAKNKPYGDARTIFTYTPSPKQVNGNSFTGSLLRAAVNNVDTYTIQSKISQPKSHFLIN